MSGTWQDRIRDGWVSPNTIRAMVDVDLKRRGFRQFGFRLFGRRVVINSEYDTGGKRWWIK